MRDPFDSTPALRLGDALAKRLIVESRVARETGIQKGYGPGPVTDEQKSRLDEAWDALGLGEIFAKAMELRDAKESEEAKRPSSLDPAFGDAFGEALSRPKTHRDGLVDWIEEHGAYSFDVDHDRCAVTITGVVRKPVGDGATRYEPAPPLKAYVSPEIIAEIDDVAQFAALIAIAAHETKGARPVGRGFVEPIDHGEIPFFRSDETDAEFRERIRANHAALIAKKDDRK